MAAVDLKNELPAKRGRPFTQMGEFDFSLIREFRARPAFYDRNAPRYRDKQYTASLWQDISNKLGYDVSLLKDRMLQLRNRYNLEKRRLDEQRSEGDPCRSSPWPLYEHLDFFAEHIRPRRSYRSIMASLNSSSSITDASNSCSNLGPMDGDLLEDTTTPLANGLVTVKVEEEDDFHAMTPPNFATNTAAGSQAEMADSGRFILPHNSMVNLHSSDVQGGDNDVDHASPEPRNMALPPNIVIRRFETMKPRSTPMSLKQRRSAATPPSQMNPARFHSPQQKQHQRHYVPPMIGAKRSYPEEPPRELSAGDQKFAAFGQFMYMSLLDMPPKKALLLINKFTADVIEALLKKEERLEGESVASTATATGAAASLDETSPTPPALSPTPLTNGGQMNGGDV